MSDSKKRKPGHLRVVRQAPMAANQAWALDFVATGCSMEQAFAHWR